MQFLQGVDTIHKARIVHSDLKPANFLLVAGQLKLIDFGIAKAIKGDTTSIARENQARHLWDTVSCKPQFLRSVRSNLALASPRPSRTTPHPSAARTRRTDCKSILVHHI